MTPFMKIFALLEQRQQITRSDAIEALGSRGAANRVLDQLRDRGDIRLVARGVYAQPGTPNLQKASAA